MRLICKVYLHIGLATAQYTAMTDHIQGLPITSYTCSQVVGFCDSQAQVNKITDNSYYTYWATGA